MRTAVLFFVLLAFPILLFAGDEKIEGGFGIILGEQASKEDLPGAMDLEELDSNGDETVYQFIPEHPYQPLTEYSVSVTPYSKKVYQIQATGLFKKKVKCVKELGKLEKILSEKYGDKNIDSSLRFTKLNRINYGKGARRIYAGCMGYFNNHTLKLTYVDQDLRKAGMNEKPAKVELGTADTEARDASGL